MSQVVIKYLSGLCHRLHLTSLY